MPKPPVSNGCLSWQSQIKKIVEIPPAPEWLEMARTGSKRRASSSAENQCSIPAKLPKATGVTTPECHGDNGKEELHPDRSDKTSNEQTLKQKEELRKKEQELRQKKNEIKDLKKEKKNVQHKSQKQAQKNKTLTARIGELEKEVERLNAEIKKLKKELKKMKGNQHFLRLAAMCDQLQKNFYQIVFYPHDFSKYKQSYKEDDIEDNIKEGHYGLTTEEKKHQARERWSDLKNKLDWESIRHVRGIKQLKNDRNRKAHPKITKGMKKRLEDGAKALSNERELDEPTFGIVQNLIEMWFKTEDLVQEQEEKKNKERNA